MAACRKILLLLLVSLSGISAECPVECVCMGGTDAFTGMEGYVVSCIDLTHLPAPWPSDITPVTEFYLNGLNMDNFPAGLFQDMPQIKFISIRFSNIGTIDSGAFTRLNGTSSDAVLMLGYNNIGSISGQAFHSLSNFASIQIVGGSVGTIHSGAFTDIQTGSFIISEVKIEKVDSNAFGESVNFHLGFSLPSNLKALPEEVLKEFPALNSTGFAGCDDRALQDSKTSFVSLISNNISIIATDAFSGIQSVSLMVVHSNTIGLIRPKIFGPTGNAYAIAVTRNSIEALDDHAFGGLHSTNSLLVSHNEVSCYDPEALDGIEAEYVILGSNSVTPVDPSDNRTFCLEILKEPTTTAMETTMETTLKTTMETTMENTMENTTMEATNETTMETTMENTMEATMKTSVHTIAETTIGVSREITTFTTGVTGFTTTAADSKASILCHTHSVVVILLITIGQNVIH